MNKNTHSTSDGKPGDYSSRHNKKGEAAQTQLNQNRRTPGSRSDRDDHLGSRNQSSQRKKGPLNGG
jgi:hypothetical protein